MTHKFNPQNVHKLDDETRRNTIPPEKVLQYMNIKSGDTLLDIGAGIGYFAVPALKLVGDAGKVIATDISETLLTMLKQRIPQNTSKSKIKVIISDEYKIPLPDAVANKILMAFVLHEIERKQVFLSEIKRLLKKDGAITIIEWNMIESSYGPPLLERIGNEEVKKLFIDIGFMQFEEIELNQDMYLLNIQK